MRLPVAAKTVEWNAWSQLLLIIAGVLHALDVLGETLEGFVVDPFRGQSGCDRFKQSSDLHDLEDRVVLDEVDGEPDAFEQKVRLQARDVRTVTLADVEDTDELKRLDRLANRAAPDAQLCRELVLGWQP